MFRRRRVVAGVVALALVTASALLATASSGPALTPLQARIVAAVDSAIGYRTDPPDSYCNRYSGYWGAGSAECAAGLRAEQWCADFAAWAWRRAGVRFVYGLAPGEINAASVSFYSWGVAHGTWHPLSSGYSPEPGDVAVYGLDPTATSAVHVAVVTAYSPGARGPDVVNGDGSRSGFSVVEVGTDQWKADLTGDGALLDGYVAPLRAPAATS